MTISKIDWHAEAVALAQKRGYRPVADIEAAMRHAAERCVAAFTEDMKQLRGDIQVPWDDRSEFGKIRNGK